MLTVATISQTFEQANSTGENPQLSISSSVKKLLTESCTNNCTAYSASQHKLKQSNNSNSSTRVRRATIAVAAQE
jgi:hypothetical protein